MRSDRIENTKTNCLVGGAIFVGFSGLAALAFFGTAQLASSFAMKSIEDQSNCIILISAPAIIGLMIMVTAICYHPNESRREIGI